MKKNYWFVMLCLLASGFIGCSDDDNDYDWYGAFMEEQARLAEFVKDKSPLKTFTYTGIEYDKKSLTDYAYLFEYDENGVKPKAEQFVLVNFVRKDLNEKVLDSSYPSATVGAGITPTYQFGGPICIQLSKDGVMDALSDAFKCMAENTTGSILMSRVWTNMTTFLYFDYTIEKIIQEETLLAYENKLIANSLEELSLPEQDIIDLPANETNARDTIGKIALLERGQGALVEATDSVTIWMEGEILDEINTKLRKFMTRENESDTDKMKVSELPTKGLRMAVLKLREGDKAKVYLPSGMAFGYEGGINMGTGQYMIPSYSTLVFTVKVVSTKKNPSKS